PIRHRHATRPRALRASPAPRPRRCPLRRVPRPAPPSPASLQRLLRRHRLLPRPPLPLQRGLRRGVRLLDRQGRGRHFKHRHLHLGLLQPRAVPARLLPRRLRAGVHRGDGQAGGGGLVRHAAEVQPVHGGRVDERNVDVQGAERLVRQGDGVEGDDGWVLQGAGAGL
ncbi:hypothetical protein DFJ74DRAFT_746995, partial [Hyaloraphidium curvatum]